MPLVGLTLRVYALLLRLAVVTGSALALSASVSIPVAIATIYNLSSHALLAERGLVEPGGAGWVEVKDYPGEGCAYASLSEASIGGYGVLVVYTTDTARLTEVFGVPVRGGQGVLAGHLLALRLNLSVGSNIRLCGPECLNLTLTGIALGGGVLAYSIIVGGEPPSPGLQVYFCPREGSLVEVAADIALGQAVEAFALLGAIALAAYVPVVYAAAARLLEELGAEASLIHEAGAPLRAVKASLVLVAAAVSGASALYGVAAGTFLLHLSQWALRFAGVVTLAKPVPGAQFVLAVLAASALLGAASTFLALRLRGSPLEAASRPRQLVDASGGPGKRGAPRGGGSGGLERPLDGL